MRFLRLFLASVSVISAQQLPEGPGKEAVQKVCTTCHDIDTVFGSRRTKIAWERSVEKMISHGAKGSDDEFAAIIEYLTKNFGKVNINTASAAELEQALSLPGTEAEAIREYRGKNGKIKDFEELKKIPGLNQEQLVEKRSLIAFNE